MARIPLPSRETLSPEMQQRWDRMEARGPVLNVLRMFMTNPEIELNARGIWAASGLDPRTRELLILRCAFHRQSTYEWHQHVRIARDAGVPDDDIRAVADWRASDRFSEPERTVLAYVDALAAGPRPDDATFDTLSAGRTPGEVFGVTFLATLYFQLAHVMSALDLETEVPFVGWQLENG